MREAYSSPHHGSKLSWGIRQLPPPNRKSIPLAVLCWDLFSSWSTLLIWSRVPWVQGKTWVDFCSGLWRLTGTRKRDRYLVDIKGTSGRDVPYVTAWMLPPPSQPAFHSSLVHLWLSQLSLFLSIITFICKNLQNVRNQGNVKTLTQRRGRKSMLLCQKSTCPFQKALCWILYFERSYGPQLRYVLRSPDISTAETAQNQQCGTFSYSISALGLRNLLGPWQRCPVCKSSQYLIQKSFFSEIPL